ncbi:hypothetical protein [Fastidiosibacter lacustris]|uniref:hypothetical protein n=1 Tax=Fastidiosibacter lacustris TaxID=2056695 RepID=UPI000E355B49|nr:hypothetical protein [Fastidiosibacter lacustris]
MSDRLETLKKSQRKIREALKESGKVQFSDWLNGDTLEKIGELKKALNFRRKGEVIDKIVSHYYEEHTNKK